MSDKLNHKPITDQSVSKGLAKAILHDLTPDASGTISPTQLHEVGQEIALELGYDTVPAFITRTVIKEASKL